MAISAIQFIVMSSLQMIIPFLPYYIEELGVTDPHDITIWTGIIASANFLASAIMSPVWGSLVNRFSCKTMVMRAVTAVAIFSIFMSLAQNVYQFTAVRILMGAFSGFNAAAIALVSMDTPEENIGYAMGVVQTGQVAGTIMGPLFGGLLQSLAGYYWVFHIITILNTLAAFAVLILIKESNQNCYMKKESLSFSEAKWLFTDKTLLIICSVTFITHFSMRIVEPLIPIYVKQIYSGEQFISLIAGIVIASTGVANMLGAPFLGYQCDKSGYKKTLVLSLLGASIFYILQAMVKSPWQLAVLRFFLGFCIAGTIPTINAIISHLFSKEKLGKVYGVINSARSLGNFAGPLIGSSIATWFSISYVFWLAGILLLINMLWVSKTLTEPKKYVNNIDP